MSAFLWSPDFELGHELMDRTHREFVDLVNALATASDAELPQRLDEFLNHTDAHFAQELRWMKSSGFPPLHCHETEHARVLEVAEEVRERLVGGDLEMARVLAREIPDWFRDHAATMDAALAQWLRQTQWASAA
jgi:hemerythrin-like metal-binding protein